MQKSNQLKMARSTSKSDPKSIAVTIPDAFMAGLGAELRALIGDNEQSVTGRAESVDSALLDAVEQIVSGTLKSGQFVALLNEVGMTTANKAANVSVVNVLWLYGTQVRQASNRASELYLHCSGRPSGMRTSPRD